MSKLSNPERAYSAITRAAASRSSVRPSRSMSATCHRPVTTRLISSPGASTMRSGRGMIGLSGKRKGRAPQGRGARRPNEPALSRGSLRPNGAHLVDGHLADRRDLAVLNPPEPEGTRDVAVLVEAHGPDHALVADRLAVLDELERPLEAVGPCVDHLAVASRHLADGVPDGGGFGLAGLRDGEAEDRGRVVGPVGRRRVLVEAARHRGV